MKNAPRTFFILYLAVQTIVPVVQLFRPRPARFGWQMFSGTSVPTQVKIRTPAGERAIPADEMAKHVGNWRGDLSLDKHLPPHLCRRYPEASAVLLYNLEADEPREFPCVR